MFVTAKDFNLIPFNIPSLEDNNTFQPYVDEQEKVWLSKVFGDYFYDQLVEGIEDFLPWEVDVETEVGKLYYYKGDIWEALTVTLGVVPVAGADYSLNEANNRWAMLISGGKYLIKGKQYVYPSFKDLLKPLICSMWFRDYSSDTVTDVGGVKADVENGEVASLSYRITWCFNQFVDLINTVAAYLYNYSYANFDDLFVANESYTDFKAYLYDTFCAPKKINTFNF